ncbi:MAG: redoxin domain-containing protein [Saprospiraceae bacterium]|nr:redoxin domain-containing protein [Saprospiraceae bacterium]
MIDNMMLSSMLTNDGPSVLEYSQKSPVMLVFLRHFGCIFCKEALFDISKKRKSMEAKGVKIILVHMASEEVAEDYFKMFGLKGITHISDPACNFYNEFGLKKGNSSQLMGLKNWYRGFEVSVGKGIEVSIKQIGDTFQMPGVFVIKNGQVKEKYIHKTAADRPDYEKLVACCDTMQV